MHKKSLNACEKWVGGICPDCSGYCFRMGGLCLSCYQARAKEEDAQRICRKCGRRTRNAGTLCFMCYVGCRPIHANGTITPLRHRDVFCYQEHESLDTGFQGRYWVDHSATDPLDLILENERLEMLRAYRNQNPNEYALALKSLKIEDPFAD